MPPTPAQLLGNEVKKHVDHLDGVFLNAGIATITPFESESPQHFDDGFNINVRGPFFQLQSLLPLLGNPSAVVFNSSEVRHLTGFPANDPSQTRPHLIAAGHNRTGRADAGAIGSPFWRNVQQGVDSPHVDITAKVNTPANGRTLCRTWIGAFGGRKLQPVIVLGVAPVSSTACQQTVIAGLPSQCASTRGISAMSRWTD